MICAVALRGPERAGRGHLAHEVRQPLHGAPLLVDHHPGGDARRGGRRERGELGAQIDWGGAPEEDDPPDPGVHLGENGVQVTLLGGDDERRLGEALGSEGRRWETSRNGAGGGRRTRGGGRDKGAGEGHESDERGRKGATRSQPCAMIFSRNRLRMVNRGALTSVWHRPLPRKR